MTEAAAWDAALLALPNPHVLQSWTWGLLKESQGWQAARFLWRDDARILAAAQILTQQRGRLRFGYVPKGPVLDWGNMPLVDEVFSLLECYAREQKLLLLKLDPDVHADAPLGKAVLARLEKRRWWNSFEQIQFRNTMMLDVRPDLDTLMAQMKSKWRYNVRLAVRKEVTVREARLDELPLLYQMYVETSERDNFVIREQAYYLDVWRSFMEVGLALPLVAEADGIPLAMAVLLYFEAQAWYMYGASRSIQRNLMPNHLLQWEIIRRIKALGCTTYDLWGAPDELNESDPMWGVYRFKLGFGATFVPHIGAFDYAPNPWLYHIYGFLRPRIIALAHRRYWTHVENELANG